MKPRRIEPNRLVSISWVDTTSAPARWLDREYAQSLSCHPIDSTGIVVDTTPDHLTLAHSVDSLDMTAHGVFLLPWGCIKTLRLHPLPRENRQHTCEPLPQMS